MIAVTPRSVELLAKLDEIAYFAEDNSKAAIANSDRDTWAVHARKILEVAAALRLAAKPDEEGAREPLYEFSDTELRREVERRGLI